MGKTKPKTPPKPTKEEIEGRTQIWIRGIDFAQSAMRNLTILGGIFCFTYFGIYKPIEISAGKETVINYAVKFLADVKLHVWLAWGAAAGCGGWAMTERSKRLKERKEKDERIKNLEEQKDPNRTSSGLDVTGEAKLEHKL